MEKGKFIIDGVFCDSVYSCYKLQISQNLDAARVKYSYYNSRLQKEIETPAKWQSIKYDRTGNPFVTFRGKRLKLDNFMKP